MSVTPSTIIEQGGFTLANNTALDPQLITLYSLAGIYAERIESVYMQMAFGDDVIEEDVFAVRLLAPDGAVLYEQATPALTVTDPAAFVYTAVWSRQGNDTAQITPALQTDGGGESTLRGWANMRLPDLTLPPQSSVVLVSMRNVQSLNAAVAVARATITTTRNAGAVASTSEVVLNTQPILVAGPG